MKRVGDEKTRGKLTHGGDGSPSTRMEILTHVCGDYLPSGCLSNQKSGFSERVSVSTAREFILSRGHRMNWRSDHDDVARLSAGGP